MRKVIVVDMIDGFTKEGAMHDKKIMKIVPSVINVLKSTKEENRVFIADTHKENAIEFNSFPPHCLEGTNESQIIDELQEYVPVDSFSKKQIIVRKNSTNACWALNLEEFCSYSLHEELEKEYWTTDDYEEVVIVGCCTDICVMQLAIGMKTFFNEKNIDIPITIPRDCVATYDAPYHSALRYHEMALSMMELAGIKIVETLEGDK